MASVTPSSQSSVNVIASAAPQLQGIAKTVVMANVLEEKKAIELYARAASERITFLEMLSRESKSLSKRAAVAIAKAFDLPLVDIDAIDQAAFPEGALSDPKKIAELRAVPLYERGGRMFIAISDPTDNTGLTAYTHKQGRRIETVIVDDAQLSALVSALTGNAASTSELGDSIDDIDFGFDPSLQADDGSDEAGENSPVIRIVNSILLKAIRMGASDIHFEPYEKFYRVRFRIDGSLKEINRPPLAAAPYMASRIKVISRLNIAEKRIPQDGRTKIVMPGGRAIDFRVSTLPSMFGEKIVMRILDPSAAQLGIEALGYEPEEKQRLLDAIARPYGMVLVTGPTGSGKTVSLYTCLNMLNREDINISTAEDPCEIQLAGINQVNVNPAANLTFASALKSFLRQDPDIIMVGEIRDEETAEISVKAAQTGHLVLATLHTNDAPKTISRLVEIGVKPYNVASAVHLITAQRLARKLCVHCKQVHTVTAAELEAVGMPPRDAEDVGYGWKAYKPNISGCDFCTAGYKGRVGIYQVMPITEAIQRIVLAGGDAMQIALQAKSEGIRDLRQSALVKFRKGETSLEEVVATTNE